MLFRQWVLNIDFFIKFWDIITAVKICVYIRLSALRLDTPLHLGVWLYFGVKKCSLEWRLGFRGFTFLLFVYLSSFTILSFHLIEIKYNRLNSHVIDIGVHIYIYICFIYKYFHSIVNILMMCLIPTRWVMTW